MQRFIIHKPASEVAGSLEFGQRIQKGKVIHSVQYIFQNKYKISNHIQRVERIFLGQP